MQLPPITFELDVEGLTGLRDIDLGGLFNALARGALMGGQFVQGLWIRACDELDVRETGRYKRGIEADGIVRIASEKMVEGADGGWSTWEIVVEVTNMAKHASIVEEGHGAFRLPDVIDWSNSNGRIKRTKDGRPYIHVPFRHRAYAGAEQREKDGLTTATIKAMMPEEVYAKARKLTYTQKLGVGPIRDTSGQWVAEDRYRWGTRLDRSGTRPSIILGGPGVSAGGPGERGFEEHRGARQVGRDANGNPLINPAWQSSKFHGMFKTGSKGHTGYMTIRTVTPDSPGWNIPAQAGRFVAAKVASIAGSSGHLQDVVLSGILDALERNP